MGTMASTGSCCVGLWVAGELTGGLAVELPVELAAELAAEFAAELAVELAGALSVDGVNGADMVEILKNLAQCQNCVSNYILTAYQNAQVTYAGQTLLT